MMAQILSHLWGDYIFQSDWMALNKSKRSWPCLVHCLLYTACFLFVTRSVPALAVIFVTHFMIDRFGLARYLVWAKNHLGPVYRPGYDELDPVPRGPQRYDPWWMCSATGYSKDRPVWLTVWLLIVADNTLHLTINCVALRWLG